MGLLIRGSVGPLVHKLQEDLTALGYVVEPDGVYGAATEEQVRSFQDTYGLEADGKIKGCPSLPSKEYTGGNIRDMAIADGKVTGDDVSFSVTREVQGNTFKIIYKGKVSGEEIKFTRTIEGRDVPPTEFTAKKAK